MSSDAFSEMGYGRFSNSSAWHHLASDMHQSVQESARSDDDAFGIELSSPNGAHADGTNDRIARTSICRIFYQEFVCLILPDIQILCLIQMPAPLPDKLPSVALGPRTPHSWTFANVQHTELYRGGVSHQSHLAAEGINLAHNLPLGDTADGRIARHLRNLVHVHRHEAGFGTHIGTGAGCFAPRMTTSDDQNIIVEFHSLLIIFRKSKKKK